MLNRSNSLINPKRHKQYVKNILKCKSCGYELATKKDVSSLFYCPKCRAIGYSNAQFEIIVARQ